MTRIPASALVLGLAGLLPFLWGAAGILAPGLTAWSLGFLPGRFHGPAVMQIYGLVILSFMAGVIWGFGHVRPGAGGALLRVVGRAADLGVFFATGATGNRRLLALLAGSSRFCRSTGRRHARGPRAAMVDAPAAPADHRRRRLPRRRNWGPRHERRQGNPRRLCRRIARYDGASPSEARAAALEGFSRV
jgi:hypothetical protein